MDEATTAVAIGYVSVPADTLALRGAASFVPVLLDAGLKMDKSTAAAAFRATADELGRAEEPCKPNVVT